jgi:hypothetical protein
VKFSGNVFGARDDRFNPQGGSGAGQAQRVIRLPVRCAAFSKGAIRLAVDDGEQPMEGDLLEPLGHDSAFEYLFSSCRRLVVGAARRGIRAKFGLRNCNGILREKRTYPCPAGATVSWTSSAPSWQKCASRNEKAVCVMSGAARAISRRTRRSRQVRLGARGGERRRPNSISASLYNDTNLSLI